MPNRLKDPYPLTDVNEASNTKERILLAATVMFARKGKDSVSIRDIAKAVNLGQASLYNHFESKEVLWDSVLEHLKDLYLQYFDRLDMAIKEAVGFEAVLECMFIEVRQVINIFTYYGFSLIQAEQLNDEKAYQIYSDVFLKYSSEFIAGKFDDCITRGWAREFNTIWTAVFFMNNILFAITMRANEDMGRVLPFDVNKMLDQLQEQIWNLGRIDP